MKTRIALGVSVLTLAVGCGIDSFSTVADSGTAEDSSSADQHVDNTDSGPIPDSSLADGGADTATMDASAASDASDAQASDAQITDASDASDAADAFVPCNDDGGVVACTIMKFGECGKGHWICGDAGLKCIGPAPVQDICDNKDNNCDGIIDSCILPDGGSQNCPCGP